MTDDRRNIMVVAVTGGIASGKGVLTESFGRLGVARFDADWIARELVRPGSDALMEIIAAFGREVLLPNGELDRAQMRHRIFSDASARRRMEAILHPRVRDALLADVKRCGAPYCLVVIPLLVEALSDYDFVDRVLVVDVSPRIQRQRLMQRDGCTSEEAENMIAAQAPRAERLAIADDILDNDGDRSNLNLVAQRLHVIYLRLARAKIASN